MPDCYIKEEFEAILMEGTLDVFKWKVKIASVVFVKGALAALKWKVKIDFCCICEGNINCVNLTIYLND